MSPATATYSQWKNNTGDIWYKDPCLRKCAFYCGLTYVGLYTIGYDGSYLNGLQAMENWNEYFGHPAGNKLGLIGMSGYLLALFTIPFVNYTADRWGRKPLILAGAIATIIGAVIGTAANGIGMLIAGRLIVGAGGTWANVGCILLLAEICHPRFRGVATSLYLTCYYVGSIVASWMTFGMVYWTTSHWSWRLPTLFQATGPVVLVFCCFFAWPESPRYLMKKGLEAEAHKILADLHANGLMDDELVMNELHEMKAAIAMQAEKGNGGWASLFKTPGNRRRVLILFTIGTGTQWLGNNLISYYLAPVLRQAGVTSSVQIAGINGGISIFNWFMAIGGALWVDRWGRRPLWLTSTFAFLLTFTLLTALSAEYAKTAKAGLGYGIIATLFLVYGAYDIAWTPLAYSYTVEILPYDIRATGMSLFTGIQNLAQVFNQWVNPVALEALAWKFYLVYLALDVFYLVMVWYFFIETKGYTAEEVAVLLDGKVADSAGALELARRAGTVDDINTEDEIRKDENDKI